MKIIELDGFIRNMANQYDNTDVSMFKPDTKFREMDEWNSMIVLSVMAMVKEEYEVSLTGDDFRNSETIENLYNAVKTKL
jgi:Phosphopantetheine attachment site.